MFKFLKDKLKKTINVFSKKVEDEVAEEPQEKVKEELSAEEIVEEVKEKTKSSKPVKKEKKEAEVKPVKEILKEEPVKEEAKEKVVEEKIFEEVQEVPETEDLSQEEDREEAVEADEITPTEEAILEGYEADEDRTETTPAEEVSAEDVVEEILRGGEEPQEEIKEDVFEEVLIEEPKEEPKEKMGFFSKLVSKKLDENKFEDLFWDLEVALLENNVSVKVIEKIKEDLKEALVNQNMKRGKIFEIIKETLTKSLTEILDFEKIDLMKNIENKKPYVICFFGINGSGKTTSIAKFTKMLLDKNKTVVLAAADTFRAAAIDQLQEHADKLDVKLIKQDYGSDPAAVAFDAIKHAESKGIDVVLVDTAGRLHSNANLLEEMKKIIRVSNPDLKIFVGESITGNDCIEQAENFNEAVGIDGIILSKADIDEKGGASISVGYVTKKPILFIGTGQEYDDFEEFNADKVLKTLDF